MARCRLLDLVRLDANLANKKTVAPSKDAEWQSIVVLNALAAPLFILFSGDTPSASRYDLAIPGESLFVHPIPEMAQLTAVSVYPGAVPAGDVNEVAIIRLHEAVLPVFVGPLNA